MLFEIKKEKVKVAFSIFYSHCAMLLSPKQTHNKKQQQQKQKKSSKQ